MLNRAINRSQNYILSAPVGGLNLRDGMDDMLPTDAIVMDNYYPSETKVSLRGGYKTYALNDENIKVETLIPFSSPLNKRIFAIGEGKIFDVSSGSNVIEKENLLHNRWHYVQFKNNLIMCNGVDEPLTYFLDSDNVWKWKETDLQGTNLDKSMLTKVIVSKQRLFFVENNSLNYWYSESVGEVQGNLNKVDLSSLTSKGGFLKVIACWTQDGGQGIDDLTVFITSEGEVLVYAGSNPSNADDWTLKGKYFISAPVGEYCIVQYGGDIVVICEDGYVPLSSLVRGQNGQVAYSDKIRGLVLSRIRDNKKLNGWQGIIYPRGGYALFNVPVRNSFEQHIINMSSGAWCRFTGINACCWCLFEGRLYFGNNSGVFRFDDGYSDNGLPICGNVHQAYCNLGCNDLKKIQMLNPRTKSSAAFALNIYTNMDFADEELEYVENINNSEGTQWNKKKWSSSKNLTGTKWSTLKGSVRNRWIGNSATGFKASLVFKTKTRGNLIEWYNTGFRFERGGGIV